MRRCCTAEEMEWPHYTNRGRWHLNSCRVLRLGVTETHIDPEHAPCRAPEHAPCRATSFRSGRIVRARPHRLKQELLRLNKTQAQTLPTFVSGLRQRQKHGRNSSKQQQAAASLARVVHLPLCVAPRLLLLSLLSPCSIWLHQRGLAATHSHDRSLSFDSLSVT